MKKRITAIGIALVMCFSVITFTGCNNPPPDCQVKQLFLLAQENGFEGTFEEWLQAIVGPIGQDGLTPHIGANGNWFIGETDTGVRAAGKSAFELWQMQPGNEGKSLDDFFAWLQSGSCNCNNGSIITPINFEILQWTSVRSDFWSYFNRAVTNQIIRSMSEWQTFSSWLGYNYYHRFTREHGLNDAFFSNYTLLVSEFRSLTEISKVGELSLYRNKYNYLIKEVTLERGRRDEHAFMRPIIKINREDALDVNGLHFKAKYVAESYPPAIDFRILSHISLFLQGGFLPNLLITSELIYSLEEWQLIYKSMLASLGTESTELQWAMGSLVDFLDEQFFKEYSLIIFTHYNRYLNVNLHKVDVSRQKNKLEIEKTTFNGPFGFSSFNVMLLSINKSYLEEIDSKNITHNHYEYMTCDSTILVMLTREATREGHFTVQDFPEVNLYSVRCITAGFVDGVHVSGNFRRTFVLTLQEPSSQNVLDAIAILQKRPDIHIVERNFL